jgi:hypothetical protein
MRRPVLILVVGLAAAAAARADETQSLVRRMGELKTRAAARPYVVLRRFVCASSGASADDLRADLEEARGVYAACGLDVRAEPARTIASDYGPSAPCQLGDDHASKTLTPDQLALFSRYPRPDGELRVFYLSFRSGPEGPTTAGTSFPEDYLRLAKGGSPEAKQAIGAVVVFHKARRFTGKRYVLAHEMGHVLLDDSAHRAEKENLMRDWDGGKRLDKAQCLTLRASPFVRRD